MDRSVSKTNLVHYRAFLLAISAATLVAALGALCIGRYPLTVSSLLEMILARITGRESTATDAELNVFWLVRLPRVIAAVLVGAGLAVSGSAYQSIFKNPLAAPELLGVFQGSCVGAAAAILLSLGGMTMQMFALAGGIGAVSLTICITRIFKSNSTATLVLSGVIVSGLMSSILGLLKYFMDVDTQLPAMTYWQMGSLANLTMEKVYKIAPTMVVSLIFLLALRWQFNLLSVGDNEARSMGVNLVLIRSVTILFSTLLTSCAVCLGGTISWVGLLIPHFSRAVIGPDNVKLTPVAIFCGAFFLVIIDTIGRTLTGMEIPLSILTGLVGAPGFVFLIARQKNGGVK